MLLPFRSLVAAVLAVVSSLCGHCADARNPGIALRLSEQFFTYVLKGIATPLIHQEIAKVKIPDVTAHIPYINTDIYITGLVFDPNSFRLHEDSFLLPNTNMTSLEAKVGVYVSGNGHWRTRTRWWPHISESGSVHFETSPMWVVVAVSMKPGSNGIWNFTLEDFGLNCDLALKFTGDGMSGIDVGALRKDINNDANEAASKELTTLIGNVLDNLTPILEKYLPYVHLPQDCDKGFLPPICKDFAVNLSLTSAGVWKDRCYCEVQLDGYVLYRNKGFNPAASKPFPAIPSPCGDRHLSLLLSGSTFTSAINAVLASGKVNVNVPSGLFCDDPKIGLFIPGLGKTFGHQPLYANITLINSKFSLTPGRATVSINTIFQALADTTPKGQKARTFEKAFTMDTTISISLNAWIKPLQTPKGMYSMLCLNFTSATVESASVPSSSVGHIPAFAIKDMVELLIVGAISKADKILAGGAYVFPRQVHNISIVRPEILIGEGYIKMAFDVDHSRNKSEDVSAQWEASNKLRSDKSPLADQLVAAVDLLAQSVSDAILEGQEHFLKFVTMMFLMEV